MVSAAAEGVFDARGARARRVAFERTQVPMVMVDAGLRFVEVNRPALLWFRVGLDAMRRFTIGDLETAPRDGGTEQAWARLIEGERITGRHPAYGGDGSDVELVYHGVAQILPGLHLIAFAPADWPEYERDAIDDDRPDAVAGLTPREIDVLVLAADGLSGPAVARELVVSLGTVRTHLANIYAKLGVPNRAAAVAKAIRLGVID
jgi:DNA-binding CsgD family transcriptional regulator